MKDKSHLYEIVERKINSIILMLEENKVDIIQPTKIAELLMADFDPESKSPDLIAYLSSLQLRERIRKALAKCYSPVKPEEDVLKDSQGELFEGVLQERYPVKRNSTEPQYMRRELMTDQELLKNAETLRKTGQSYVEHCDALYAYVAARGEKKAI